MNIHKQRTTFIAVLGFMLAITIFLGGCSDIRPIDPQSPDTPAAPGAPSGTETVKVIYNYKDGGKVTLSANHITLKKGQTLILEPAAGLTQKTRFLSSGENFFSDVMEQVKTDNSKLIFVAKAAGKGKLQVIPNYTETERAVDLWVTVQ